MKDIHEYDNVRNIKLDFSNSGYNEDIVKAFEYAYIQNEENRQSFINEQYNFIDKNLSIKERIILNDYTKKNSFALYTAYVSRGTDEDWFKKYKTENREKAFCFGDSFFYQIWSEFKNDFYTMLNIDPNLLKEHGTEIFDKYWEIQNYKRIKCFDLSLFHESFNKEQWEQILKKFIEDINSIILKAPKTKSELYCYRGVNKHYIHSYSDPLSNIFISGRFSSFSLNFNKSFGYYKSFEDSSNKCMYKTVIKANVNVLFLPRVSFAPDELEILTPINTVFIYEKQDSGADIPMRECHNNRNNKYGICSFETKLNCVNVLIDNTPELATYTF
jgi:hypothetical protein